MPEYEWVGDGAYRDHRSGGEVEPGETVELPERVAAPVDALRRVAKADDEPAGDTTAPPFDPGEYSVAELRDALEDVRASAAVRAVRDAESAGDARSTALEAIDARLDEV